MGRNKKSVIDKEHPCKGCRREEVTSCWKQCVRYKKWFFKVWRTVTGRLKRDK